MGIVNYKGLNKVIRKGAKIEKPSTIIELLLTQLNSIFKDKYAREFHFLTLYYGLQGEALTLEEIGKNQDPNLTRERVRQIISNAVHILNTHFEPHKSPNIYVKAEQTFLLTLLNKKFLRFEELTEQPLFADFKKNTKGLIALLNDAGIKQIAYRKNYYFYPPTITREEVIELIQKENKILRREITLQKLSLKSKTVTYVPDEVRKHLLSFSQKKNLNLNVLYEDIILSFIKEQPYSSPDFQFIKTKSWKARKGTAKWQQIGIYIDKETFELIRSTVSTIKTDYKKTLSIMSFICQAFMWHYQKHKNK